jgi:hypothetical protein
MLLNIASDRSEIARYAYDVKVARHITLVNLGTFVRL